LFAYDLPPVHQPVPAIIRADDATTSTGNGTVLDKSGNTILYEMPYVGGSIDAAKTAVLDAAASDFGVDPATLKVTSISQSDTSVVAVISMPPPSDATNTAPSGPPSLSNWIMVVPVTAELGDIPLWDRTSAWARSWVTPQQLGNSWIVGVAGDSADVTTVTAAYLNHLSSSSDTGPISYLFNKYSPKYIDIADYDPQSGTLSNFFYNTSGFVSTDTSAASDQNAATSATLSFVTDTVEDANNVASTTTASNPDNLTNPATGTTPNGMLKENIMGSEVSIPATPSPNQQYAGPGLFITK
jgi:hypothetical protein